MNFFLFGVLLILIKNVSMSNPGRLRQLLEIKNPRLFQTEYLSETPASNFISFINEYETNQEAPSNDNQLLLICSFISDYSWCQVSREIFEKLLELNPSNNFIFELTSLSIWYDQEEAFLKLFQNYRSILQDHEDMHYEPDDSIKDSILSRPQLYKYGIKMIQSGFRFYQPEVFVQNICNLMGLGRRELEYSKEFLKFLIIERRMVEEGTINDVNGLIREILNE